MAFQTSLILCMDQWKPIPDTNDRYFINDNGDVLSQQKGAKPRLLKQKIDRGGYKTVVLFINGKQVTKFVHRLVATVFVSNQLNKPFVNHLNGIKTDNHFSNLEWVSHAENIQHAFKTGLIKAAGKKVKHKLTGKLFDSIKEAAEFEGINRGTCRNYLNGNIKKNPTQLRFAVPYYCYIFPKDWTLAEVPMYLNTWQRVGYS